MVYCRAFFKYEAISCEVCESGPILVVDANIAMLYKGIPQRTTSVGSVIAYPTTKPLKNDSRASRKLQG